jgi:hypothetical protein
MPRLRLTDPEPSYRLEIHGVADVQQRAEPPRQRLLLGRRLARQQPRLNAVHPRASLHPTDAGVFLTPGQGFRTGGTHLRMNVGTPRALLRKALGSMAEPLERVWGEARVEILTPFAARLQRLPSSDPVRRLDLEHVRRGVVEE